MPRPHIIYYRTKWKGEHSQCAYSVITDVIGAITASVVVAVIITTVFAGDSVSASNGAYVTAKMVIITVAGAADSLTTTSPAKSAVILQKKTPDSSFRRLSGVDMAAESETLRHSLIF